jgi:hypothetical protein
MKIESDTNNFSLNNFKSRDLYLSAFLLATDHEFIEASYCSDGGFYFFEFRDKDTCEYQERLFSLGKTSVSTQKFIESIKYLKRLVAQ